MSPSQLWEVHKKRTQINSLAAHETDTAVSVGKTHITFSDHCIEVMQSPLFVTLAVSYDHKQWAIQPTTDNPNGFTVSSYPHNDQDAGHRHVSARSFIARHHLVPGLYVGTWSQGRLIFHMDPTIGRTGNDFDEG